jgi:hypothetical protein
MDSKEILKTVLDVAKEVHLEAEINETVTKDTPLVGTSSLLDSMALVQLCLALEDKAQEIGFEFDWTSETAMSKSKGMYRSVTALADEFYRQYKNTN